MSCCLEMGQKILMAEHIATMCFNAGALAELSRPCSRLKLGRLCSHFVARWHSSEQIPVAEWWEFENFCIGLISAIAAMPGDRDPIVQWFLNHWDSYDQIELRLYSYLSSRQDSMLTSACDAFRCGPERVPDLRDLVPFENRG